MALIYLKEFCKRLVALLKNLKIVSITASHFILPELQIQLLYSWQIMETL